jgi:hypothetical protein
MALAPGLVSGFGRRAQATAIMAVKLKHKRNMGALLDKHDGRPVGSYGRNLASHVEEDAAPLPQAMDTGGAESQTRRSQRKRELSTTTQAVRACHSRSHPSARLLAQLSLGHPATRGQRCPSEKDAKWVQKLAQLRPFIAVLPQECMGQLASFGPT